VEGKMRIVKCERHSEPEAFTVTSGALRVTDPCYDVDTRCAGQIDKVRNGIWMARVGYYKDPNELWEIERHLESLHKKLAHKEANFLKEIEGMSEEVLEVKSYTLIDDLKRNIARCEESIAEYPGRVAYIQIAHGTCCGENTFEPLGTDIETEGYERLKINVDVDLGQAGFFDLAMYTEALSDKDLNGSDAKFCKFDTFYKQVCNLTSSDARFGSLEFGAVSSSGYGDGSYAAFAKRDSKGYLESALIVFLAEYDDEE
jgi:hypothetical protein